MKCDYCNSELTDINKSPYRSGSCIFCFLFDQTDYEHDQLMKTMGKCFNILLAKVKKPSASVEPPPEKPYQKRVSER